MTTKTPAPRSALALAATPIAVTDLASPQPPQNIMQMMGAVNREDMLAILKQNKREELTEKKAAITKRLYEAQAAVSEIATQLDALGPTRIGQIDRTAADKAAKALADAGFGKFGVEVTFDGRNDEKKVYEFTVKIVNSAKDAPSYDREQCTLDATLLFDAETKTLLKQAASAQAKVADIQQELLEVKKEFANIPELIESARAELARQMVASVEGGQELLSRLEHKRQVITVEAAA